MGTGEWQYDAQHHTLIWEAPHQTWLLKIDDGTDVPADSREGEYAMCARFEARVREDYPAAQR